jgi:hypothetical protein
MTEPTPPWAIKPLVPEEVYTDREEFIEYFHKAALKAATRRTMSTVLLGARRMGKTEIFKQVVNRLFFEQDYKDPKAVIPVWYSFPDEDVDRIKFAAEYVENFIRWYAAFRMRNPGLLDGSMVKREKLSGFIKKNMEITKGFQGALNLLEWIPKDEVTIPEKMAVNLPRSISDRDDITIVMFLDEFQNTHLPQYNFRIVGYMQNAVESPTCPHFVTGSAMSILVNEILGRGALFGRFDNENIKGLTDYHGAELAGKAGRYYGSEIPQTLRAVVSNRCGGNPFYITALIRQAAKQGKIIDSEETLNELLAVDVSTGFIWAELNDQVERWIERINGQRITKWILYLAALETEERISLTRIQEELKRRERKEIPLNEIKDVLVRLSRGDLLEYKAFGEWFGKVHDPILNEFLKIWGKIEVEGFQRNFVAEKTVKKYKIIERKFYDYKGYLAEVHIIQILWNAQRKTLPGKFFHTHEDIKMPGRFYYIDQRRKFGEGRDMEIDIYGGAATEIWIAESRWRKEKAGVDGVNRLIRQAEMIREKEREYLEILRVWLFSGSGFTETARQLLAENGFLWSDKDDLNGLLEHLSLRKLPEMDADE